MELYIIGSMEQKNSISIAKDFSIFPGARYRADGEHSGEEFYEDLLKSRLEQAIESNQKLLIDFDGTWGYPSSFISEIFTRAKKDFMHRADLSEILEFKTGDEPLLRDKILYILRAKDDAKRGTD